MHNWNTYQLDNWVIHLGVELRQTHVNVVDSARLAVHMERDAILGELQRQRSYGAGLIDVGYLKVAWLCRTVGTDVQRDALLLAVQEEGHLVLQHGKVDHEQRLNRNVQLATGSTCQGKTEKGHEWCRGMSYRGVLEQLVGLPISASRWANLPYVSRWYDDISLPDELFQLSRSDCDKQRGEKDKMFTRVSEEVNDSRSFTHLFIYLLCAFSFEGYKVEVRKMFIIKRNNTYVCT